MNYEDAWRPAEPSWCPSHHGTYVYYLDIRYPPGSQEPGWRPDCWDTEPVPPALRRLMSRKDRQYARWQRNREFRWPRERDYLSSSGAYARAGLLRWYGAEVTVCRSLPVRWPHEDEAGRDPYPAAFDASGLPAGTEPDPPLGIEHMPMDLLWTDEAAGQAMAGEYKLFPASRGAGKPVAGEEIHRQLADYLAGDEPS